MSYEQGLLIIFTAMVTLLGLGIFRPQISTFLRLVRQRPAVATHSQESAIAKAAPVRERTPLPQGKSQLRPVPVVDFDPSNLVHQAALYMLMTEQCAHPTLRFHFDSSRFDNVVDACLFDMAAYAIPAEAKLLAKKTAAMKRALATPTKLPAKPKTKKRVALKSKITKKTDTVNKKVGRKQKSDQEKLPSLKLC
jgi:hypothetical protein